MDELSESRIPPSACREHLAQCLDQDCDIDPMILRVRMLRHQGDHERAHCLEQELMPLF